MSKLHLAVNMSNALQHLEAVKSSIEQSDDPKLQASTTDDLNMLINLLESPILLSIATLQDSVAMLATQVAHHPSILPADFDITPAGELALHTRNLYGGSDVEEEQRVPQISPPHSLGYSMMSHSQENDQILSLDGTSIDSNISHQQAINILQQARGLVDMVTRSSAENGLSNASSLGYQTHGGMVIGEWAQVEVINLVNDGTGLGFGIIGARTNGVIVKTILAGGVADRDGRLCSGDYILQIGDVSLLEMVSEQVAAVLRASGTRVRLVVARPADPVALPASNNHSIAPIVPSRLLSDPEALDSYLLEAGFDQVFNSQPTQHLVNQFPFDSSATSIKSDAESPEVDCFTVQLKKDENGLGITIAGYVCEKEELSGIFVKSVTAGSAAALSGRVRVNDRIVAVDGVSLAGRSNQRAVDALKSSGNIVTLQLERYLRGPKYEQLQQAIAANEGRASSPPLPANPFLHMHRADSEHSDPYQTSIPMTSFKSVSGDSGAEEEDAASDSLNQSSVRTAIVESCNTALTDPTLPPLIRQPSFQMPTTPEMEEEIKRKWKAILGEDVDIVVGVVVRQSGGLGISLEGTVDVEGGREVRPHHYMRSVLPEGPVGRTGIHQPGDELLEVNGYRLLGMNHKQVVGILKQLPSTVCMVCARPKPLAPLTPPSLVKAKSDGSLAASLLGEETAGKSLGAPGTKMRSRSLEPLTGLAMWSSDPQVIELVKGERGLGFSILDYQDPLRPSHTVIVIRSLVPGGVAQQDGRLIPGDRLLFVNDQNLENATLDQAVQALKGAPRGTVRIAVAKPLPFADTTPGITSSPTLPFNKMNTQ